MMSSNFKLYNVAVFRLAAGCGILLAAGLCAQTEMPVGVYRGVLVSSQAAGTGGDITIRDPQGAELLCHYDAQSYVERDRRHTSMPSIQPGETVEVLAGHKPGSVSCYVRLALVINPAQEEAAAERARRAAFNAHSFFFTPTGDRTVAGVVVGITSRLLMLRTKTGDAALVLRPDTKYIDDGVRTEHTDLHVNTRVFVRAGRSIDGIVEAYQVIWGRILAVP